MPRWVQNWGQCLLLECARQTAQTRGIHYYCCCCCCCLLPIFDAFMSPFMVRHWPRSQHESLYSPLFVATGLRLASSKKNRSAICAVSTWCRCRVADASRPHHYPLSTLLKCLCFCGRKHFNVCILDCLQEPSSHCLLFYCSPADWWLASAAKWAMLSFHSLLVLPTAYWPPFGDMWVDKSTHLLGTVSYPGQIICWHFHSLHLCL